MTQTGNTVPVWARNLRPSPLVRISMHVHLTLQRRIQGGKKLPGYCLGVSATAMSLTGAKAILKHAVSSEHMAGDQNQRNVPGGNA